MKKRIFYLFITVLAFTSIVLAQDNNVRVMTFNIRYDSPNDGVNIWQNRKDKVVSTILFQKADIIGLQEATKHQLEYVDDNLKEFKYCGVGRDDGKEGGEYSPILFNTKKFELINSHTFWLSETPDVPSMGWDAAYKRVCSWVKLKNKITKDIFFVFNTHFDHVGIKAKNESASLLMKKVIKITKGDNFVIMGDFNSDPDSDVYKKIVSYKYNDITVVDSKTVSVTPHHGSDGTFTNFEITAVPLTPIDHIFVKQGVKVLYHATVTDSFNGLLPSDHYPVLAELKF